MHHLRLLPLVCCFALLAPAQGARAAWPTDPAANFPVADGSSDQAQTKLVPALDGGTWVSWFDGIGTGYDVRVQKLDAEGNEVFAHNGILVANRSFSSTQDYGLDADASGNALLVFRDDRLGGTRITAALVTGAGAQPWGVNGVQLTSTTDFVAAPKVAGTSDGGCVVAWTQGSSTKVQKLDASGVPQWATEVTLTPATGSYSVSDLHGSGTDAMLAFVHQTGGFGSPRHILAQKFDASGALQWGASHVAVLDGGSLQFGNFPYFEPDGAGGGVFSWYDTAGATLQCYAQHILANGAEAFPHNGTAVSTNTVRVRVSPWASFNRNTGETYVFWQEQNSLQSQSGVYGQKLDASGVRQWGAEGVVIVPLGAASTTQVRTAAGGTSGAFVFWSSAPSFGTDRLYGAGLDAGGSIVIPKFDACSVASSKLRLVVAPLIVYQPARGTGPPFVVLAWTDGRTDDGDVYVQNVNSDGTLGPWATAVPTVTPGDSAPTLGAPRPNPSSAAVSFSLALPRGTSGTLAIHDLRGRRVRQFHVPSTANGFFTWDGRDDAHRPVASGVYFVELRTDVGVTTQRVTLVR